MSVDEELDPAVCVAPEGVTGIGAAGTDGAVGTGGVSGISGDPGAAGVSAVVPRRAGEVTVARAATPRIDAPGAGSRSCVTVSPPLLNDATFAALDATSAALVDPTTVNFEVTTVALADETAVVGVEVTRVVASDSARSVPTFDVPVVDVPVDEPVVDVMGSGNVPTAAAREEPTAAPR